ncbi:MAG: tRNA (N6-isopentenyl adenosine(37)-C2)-methylthiotransferase MiaB [Candidatus Krumholzibacteriota bacterium]|nr:tRNA (N6-isopentenyl adenosine(37)-C2)-methylthiotransferase MiaB [Candidatus Krumholzibacteriota bacterium]
MKEYSVYYESFGCQMNAFDTEVIEGMMLEAGFSSNDSPADSDVIIVNTCSVRENAETRALGRLNDLSRHKQALIVACGCMAQRMGDSLLEAVQGLSLVSGPDNYATLPGTVKDLLESGERRSLTDMDGSVTYPLFPKVENRRVSRFLSITRGCENFCSYCIVPYLRGKVRSKGFEQIIDEINMLHSRGAREVTLLGQNVMAYNSDGVAFTDLIERVISGTDIDRIRFLTTHPRDIEMKIFELMATNKRLCPHIHLPFQSGSDRILGMMNRGYSRSHYINIISNARNIKPDLAITTDIIVGFPTETDDDFKETLDIVEKARFDSAFTFKYSPREGTNAYRIDDDVAIEVKEERLDILNRKIGGIRREILKKLEGACDEILLDGTVEKGENHFVKGRTPHFRNVLLQNGDIKNGDLVRVIMKELRNFTLYCEEDKRR